MKRWTSMCILAIFHILTSMPKMVRLSFHCLLQLLKQATCYYVRDKFLLFSNNAEHFGPLFEQIAKLDEALYNIQFEQHWLEAQTDRQAICKFLAVVPIMLSYLNTNPL